MFHVKHLTVRQDRQVGQYSGETGGTGGSGSGAQVRSGGQVSGETGETGSQAVSGSGAPHSGRCALIVLARPYAKSVPYCLNFC